MEEGVTSFTVTCRRGSAPLLDRQMYAGICGTVPYSLGAYDALADELPEREK